MRCSLLRGTLLARDVEDTVVFWTANQRGKEAKSPIKLHVAWPGPISGRQAILKRADGACPVLS